MTFNDDLVHFTLSSSFFVVMFPLLYLYQAYSNLTETEKKNSKLSFETLALFYPFVFGLIFAIVARIFQFFIPHKINEVYVRYILAGGVSALIISLVLDKIFNIHSDWLRLEDTNLAHLISFVFYILLYTFFWVWFRSQILYGPSSSTPPKTVSSLPPLNKPALNETSVFPTAPLSQQPNTKSVLYDNISMKK